MNITLSVEREIRTDYTDTRPISWATGYPVYRLKFDTGYSYAARIKFSQSIHKKLIALFERLSEGKKNIILEGTIRHSPANKTTFYDMSSLTYVKKLIDEKKISKNDLEICNVLWKIIDGGSLCPKI